MAAPAANNSLPFAKKHCIFFVLCYNGRVSIGITGQMPKEERPLKIVIAGNGKVGAALTRQLSMEGYDLTLIDANQQVLDVSLEQYDVNVIRGNCASMDVLMDADIKEAELLIALTDADETNLLCCMTAHKLNPMLHTIARIRNPEYAEQIYRMRDAFGLSMAVNPEKQTADEIARLLQFPGFLKRDTFAKGRVEIVEVRVEEGSRLSGLALSEIERVVRTRVLICSVIRDGKAITPGGSFVLKEGDRIFITAPTQNLADLLKRTGAITRRIERVIICGGGRIGFYLAQQLLRSHIAVEIIDKNRERCLELAERLPEASIVHGDASNTDLLDREGVSDSDALITLTGLDELNVIVSLYGKNRNVPMVITKFGHIDSHGLLNNLPLDGVISPKELCCNSIVRYVRALKNQVGAAITVHSIADGQAEALEFRVDETTLHCGEPLKALKLRKGVLVASISRGPRTEIPNGDSVFQKGDIVIIVTSTDGVIYKLNDIFA